MSNHDADVPPADSQHLGQGANQAFEDVYHLTRLLDEYNSDRTPLDTAALEGIFVRYEAARVPRSATLVQGARKQGESRVVEGVEACMTRNDVTRGMFRHEEGLKQVYTRLYTYRECD